MRKFVSSIIILIVLGSQGYGQDIQPYLDMIQNGHIDSVRAAIEELSYQYPGSVGVRYLRALIESDATKAVAIYKDILRNHTNSEYAAPALMYLGEYYYAQGLFIQSQSVLKQLLKKHPDFNHLDYAVNLMLRGEIVAGATDSAKADLGWVRSHRPDLVIDIPAELKDVQPMREAQIELMELKSEQKAEPVRPTNMLGGATYQQSSVPPSPAKYTLQCGAFSSEENAKLLAGQIQSLGYDIQINTRDSNGRTLFVVMAGQFVTRSEADSEANNIKNALGIEKPFPKSIEH